MAEVDACHAMIYAFERSLWEEKIVQRERVETGNLMLTGQVTRHDFLMGDKEKEDSRMSLLLLPKQLEDSKCERENYGMSRFGIEIKSSMLDILRLKSLLDIQVVM